MAKGRKPIPDQLKALRGTDQPCRMSGKVDTVDRISDIREITSTKKMKLLPTKRAREIFKSKANQLIGLGILTELDIEHLAVYANSLDVLFSCMEGDEEAAGRAKGQGRPAGRLRGSPGDSHVQADGGPREQDRGGVRLHAHEPAEDKRRAARGGGRAW